MVASSKDLTDAKLALDGPNLRAFPGMPFTLAHPAAILPLRRLRCFQTVPLIIGTLVPDVPYFLPYRLGHYLVETHTLEGSFLVDLPVGMLLLVLTMWLREPLTALLSARARWVCLRSIERFSQRPRHWPIAAFSLLVGSWTHLIWDSFTHSSGWAALRVAALNSPVDLFGWETATSHVLQYASSLFGLVVLAVWFYRLVARVPHGRHDPAGAQAQWFLLSLVGAAALVIGGTRALMLWHTGSYYRLEFLVLTRVLGWFCALYLAAGVAVQINRRMIPEPAN
jgi:Domain of unknown function (DUF4184)